MNALRLALLIGAVMLTMGAAPPEGVDIERGLKKCRLCHGDDLAGKRKVPPLAGLHRQKITRKLTTDIPRKMRPVVRGLNADEKRAIAEAISKMPKPDKPEKPPATPGRKRHR